MRMLLYDNNNNLINELTIDNVFTPKDVEDAYQDGREEALKDSKGQYSWNTYYEQGKEDLIKQFDNSDYMIIHTKEYGEYAPQTYSLEEIAEEFKRDEEISKL